jgi:glycosyltransferase involved in cell wall biosynthesis
MSDEDPLVSIIIATYNWSSALRYAIASVQRQTLSSFELLVIGDGCTDDSNDVVASFHDSRFCWENLPRNSGHQSAANNRGLELARGKWIAYLGHDDLWMPNHLESLLREAEKTGADVAFSLAIVIGAPGCDGRGLFGAFEGGEFTRGSHLPPSALLHRKALTDQCGSWPDHRFTQGSPETALLERFFDGGAKFVGLSEVTVFKFPSSWRPWSYRKQQCDEQADFFERMQRPDFLHRELIELALAQELLRPHTNIAPVPREDAVLPGAIVASYRRNRGLTSQAPEEGPPQYVPSTAMRRMIQLLSSEEIRRQQTSRFTVFDIFYACDGDYAGPRHTRTLAPIGRWVRIRIPLEHTSEGAPLRFDPCDRPALIEIAWIALRRDAKVEWSLRGKALAALGTSGDAVRLGAERTLTVRTRGDDPMLFLPTEVVAGPSLVFDCWIKISRDE